MMNLKYIIASLILTVSTLGTAQKLHMPSEILDIINKSSLVYEISELKENLRPLDQSNNINNPFTYKVVEDNKISIKQYEISDEAKSIYDNAEQSFKEGKYDEAQKLYLKTLELEPNFNHVRTYIGQIHYIKKEYTEALKWYQEAIERNQIDYMSYWFMSDTYLALGLKKKALDNILMAKILNRNNPRIQNSLVKILEENKMQYLDWKFNPQIRIDSLTDNRIRIAAKPDWLPYAMVEAAWMFDPAFNSERNNFPMNRAKEGVLAMSLALKDKKMLKKYPELKAMREALDDNQIEAYIFYEILLVEKPFIAYYITNKGIENIVKYIEKNRLKKT